MSKMNFMKKKLILMIAAIFVLVFSGYVVSAEEIPKLEISVTTKITNAKKTMRVDKKVLLVVKDGKKIIPAEKVTFKSSNKKIANVSTTGYLKTKAVGKANITISYGSKRAILAITSLIPVKSVTISPSSVSVYVGKTKSLTANILPEDATTKSVTWTSSDEGIY